MEFLKQPRVQGDQSKVFDYGSGSTMQKTSPIPLTPWELSPVDETMADFEEGIRDCFREAKSSCF